MPLTPGFPSFVLSAAGLGQWWRIHRDGNAPWYFASSTGRSPNEIGRMDLPEPHGTCYLGPYPDGILSEVLRTSGVSAMQSQLDANQRRLSAMPLDAYEGKRIADFTSAAARHYGLPADFDALTRAQARPYAEQAFQERFAGVLYRLHQDPQHRTGLALFGPAGPLAEPPAHQTPPTELPVQLRNDLLAIFAGEYRGDDPLAI